MGFLEKEEECSVGIKHLYMIIVFFFFFRRVTWVSSVAIPIFILWTIFCVVRMLTCHPKFHTVCVCEHVCAYGLSYVDVLCVLIPINILCD